MGINPPETVSARQLTPATALGWFDHSRIEHRPIPMLVESPNLQAQIQEGALDAGSPVAERGGGYLKRGDPIVPLIADLREPHELHIGDAVLQLGDAAFEVPSPPVGGLQRLGLDSE